MTLKLTKQYRRKMTRKVLRELKMYREASEYHAALTRIPDLSGRKKKAAQKMLAVSEFVIEGVERAMNYLTDIEREIIRLHYTEEQTFEMIGDTVHLERSSVYRHEIRAVDKIATVLYGAAESSGNWIP